MASQIVNQQKSSLGQNRNWAQLIGSAFMLLVLMGAVVAGVLLVQREQDIRNKASSGKECQQAPDCVKIEPGNSGNHTVTKNIRYADITNRPGEEVRFDPGVTENGCYRVSIQGQSIEWEKYGGSFYENDPNKHCRDISNIQIWLVTEEPTDEPTTEPTTEPTDQPTDEPTTEPSPDTSEPPITYGCPLTPSNGQYLINFNTTRLRALSENDGTAGPFAAAIPAGTYKVTLASSDSHDGVSQADQTKEQYFVEFYADTSLVTSSNSISDLPTQNTELTEVVNQNLSFSAGINQVYLRHSAIGDTNPQSINAECALLEPQEVSITAQCLNVRVFDTNWNEIAVSDYDTLKAGDVIRFSVGGTTTDGNFTKVRFTVNGEVQPESTLFRPGTDEFYSEFTIPNGLDELSVKGELYHSILGWI